MSIRNY